MANINEKKGVSITAPFKLFSENPVDARTVVADLSELQSIIDNNAAYEGLTVYVTSEKKTYTCKKENEIFVFKNSIVEKENEQTVSETEPDISKELLGTNNTDKWANGWTDVITSAVLNLLDYSEELISTSNITSNNTTEYVLSPIIKLDLNNYDSYTLFFNSPNSRFIRHLLIGIYDESNSKDKWIACYASGNTNSQIQSAFESILTDAISSNFYYNNKLVFSLDNLKKLNEYCLSDENVVSIVSPNLCEIGDNKTFYLVFTSSCTASDEGREQVASLWSLTKFKKGQTTHHTEFNITGLALADRENRFDSKLLENVVYSLDDNDKLLNITDRKSEEVTTPEKSIDYGLNTTDDFYGESWDYAYAVTPSVFEKYPENDYLISVASHVATSYTSGYLSLPILKLNFNDANGFYRLVSKGSSYYIRHLGIYDSQKRGVLTLGETADINAAFRYALNDDTISWQSYFSTNGKITLETVKRLCQYAYDNGKASVELDENETKFYWYMTTALTKSGESNTSNAADLENGKHAWSLNYVVPSKTETQLSFRLPNLAIDNSNNYFQSNILESVMNEIGLFVKSASPENIKEIHETNTYNLYEEDPETEGKYVGNGNYPYFSPYAGYCCTKLIEIDPTKTYNHSYLRHIGIYDSQRVRIGYLQYQEAGVYDPSFWAQYPTAQYVCMSNTGPNRQGTFSYSEAKTSYTFEMPNLRLVESNGGGFGSTTQKITLKNIDRVGVIGDSYTESHYTIKDKSWLSKVSLFTDFNIENFAISGDTFRGQLNKIRTGYNRYFSNDKTGNYSWESMHPSYAILVCRTNDIKYMDESQFMYDLMGILETVRNMGAIPILTTEYHVASNDGIVAYYKYLAEKYGGYYIDLYSETLITRGKDYAPFWGGSHPGTRTNELMAHPCISFFETEMSRPYQSIKIFRPRTEPTDLDDLIFGNIYERAEKFKEISISHSALVEPKYYDNCTSRSNSAVQSEYLKLMNGVAISFDKYALFDVIFPATSNSITQIELVTNKLSDVDCYVLDPLAEPYPNPQFYRRFDVPSVLSIGTDVAVGNKYRSSLHNTTVFTLEEIKFEKVESDSGLVDGTLLLCSGNRTSTATDGGVLTKTSGTGSDTINYYYSATALSSDYPAGKQPIGHRKKLETFGLVTEKDVKRCMQVDKMSFLLVSSKEFSLSKLEVNYVGSPSKFKDTIQHNRYIHYPVLKSELTVTNTTSPMPEAITPADGCKPKTNLSTEDSVYLLNVGSSFKYRIDGLKAESKFGPRRYRVRVIARYFPDIFDSESGTFGEGTSPISLNSFDYVKLTLRLRYNNATTKQYVDFEKLVGLHWEYIDFDLLTTPSTNTAYLEFFVEDKPIQFATVSAFIESI